MSDAQVGIGLVGSGFMGRCHANAFRAVAGLFEVPQAPKLVSLADATPELAQAGARALGFERSTADWQALVSDDEVAIVAIAAPNALHAPIALAAIAAGKTVYCEKPLSTTAALALQMTEAAEAAGVTTLVGFNFLRNPMIRLAREIIAAGEIGEVTGFRGRHAENYMASAEVPHSFRTDPEGGGRAGRYRQPHRVDAAVPPGPGRRGSGRLPHDPSVPARRPRQHRARARRGR